MVDLKFYFMIFHWDQRMGFISISSWIYGWSFSFFSEIFKNGKLDGTLVVNWKVFLVVAFSEVFKYDRLDEHSFCFFLVI